MYLSNRCQFYDNSNFEKHVTAYKLDFSAVHFNRIGVKNKQDALNELFGSLNHEFHALVFTNIWLTERGLIPYFENYRSARI